MSAAICEAPFTSEYLCHSAQKLRMDRIIDGSESWSFACGFLMCTCRIRSKCVCFGFWFGWSGNLWASLSSLEIGFHFLKNSTSIVPSRASLDLMIPCSLSNGSPRFSGFFGGATECCNQIFFGQNACSSARRFGTSGGGIVDQGCSLLFASRWASDFLRLS